MVYLFVASIAHIPWLLLMWALYNCVPHGFYNIMKYYTVMLMDIFILYLITWRIRPNRYIWKSFLLPKKGSAITEEDIFADFYGRSRNGFRMLARGFLIGLLMIGFAIACALIHGDIKLYFKTWCSKNTDGWLI